MDAVGLVERGILRHAVEDEGIERHAVLVGEPLVEPVELPRRSPAPKLRGASMPASHTVTPAAFSLSMMASRLRSVTAGSVPRSASLAPSSDQHDVGLVGQHPVDPVEAARRGVARHAVIDDGDVAALRLQRRLEAGREAPGRA